MTNQRDIIKGLKFKKQAATGFQADKMAAMLEDAYLQQRRETRSGKKYSFAPSTIGYGHGTCPRYWYLAFEGGTAVDNTDALGIANMANGSQAHDRIQDLFERTGTLVAKEVEVKLQDPPVRGFIDVMVRWDDEIVVGEIKTTRQEAWMVRHNSMMPSFNHLMQILIYMKGTGKKQGFLLYENKNTQEFLIIPIDMNEKNEKLLNDTLDWLRLVWKNWQDQTVPTQPFTKKNKICKNCPVFDWCWNGAPEGTVDIPNMEVPKLA
jgi:CRISPR/Cas system-associated exonuclease Cas4 (RecB family)